MVSKTSGDVPLHGLRLGVSTSATQIEGDCTNTQWYDWYEAGRIADDTSPDVATRHFRKADVDADLLVEMGIKDYRMGLEWGRLEPERGVYDSEALQHYSDEITGLLERGIHPLVTLHHFSNPSWFEREGGWTDPSSVETFVNFARFVVEGLTDLVNDWITINEPNVVATNGFVLGVFPPGRKNLGEGFRVMNHMIEAHCLTYDVIHSFNHNAKVGVANHLRVFEPQNKWNPLDRIAAKVITWTFQGAVTEAMSNGRFLFPLRQPRSFKPGKYFDFLGLNYYTRSFVSARNPDIVNAGAPVQDLGWEVYPEGIGILAKRLYKQHHAPIWVTENGTCDVNDAFRARYIWEHLEALMATGIPIERYYHWCFVDNWEWCEGNTARFGVVHNDFDTQERTIKDSGRFYAETIKAGVLTAENHETFVAYQEYRTK